MEATTSSKRLKSVIPIAKADKGQQSAVEEITDQILSAKANDPNADTTAPQKEIDRLVYALYGLMPEQIKIVDESPPSSGRRGEPKLSSPPTRRGRTASGGGAGRETLSLSNSVAHRAE